MRELHVSTPYEFLIISYYTPFAYAQCTSMFTYRYLIFHIIVALNFGCRSSLKVHSLNDPRKEGYLLVSVYFL